MTVRASNRLCRTGASSTAALQPLRLLLALDERLVLLAARRDDWLLESRVISVEASRLIASGLLADHDVLALRLNSQAMPPGAGRTRPMLRKLLAGCSTSSTPAVITTTEPFSVQSRSLSRCRQLPSVECTARQLIASVPRPAWRLSAARNALAVDLPHQFEGV